MTYLIGIDVGTTGAKTILIDAEGHVLQSVAVTYPMYTPWPQWAEQDPEDWWQAAVRSIRQVLKESNIRGNEIAGVGLTGQMHGMVMLDARGKVLRPCIMWNDQRTAAQCEWIMNTVGRERFLELTLNPALPGFTAPKIIWTRENEPEVYAQAAKVLLPKDYLRYRLTGVYASEVSDASGTALLNVSERTWSQEVLHKLAIPPDWMPECVESPEITGRITQEVADLTGLPVGLPVVGGAGDQAASAVGTGIVEPGLVSVTVGTSGVVFAYTEEPLQDPQGRLHTFCHAVPGKWHVMGVTLSAGGSLRWIRDTLGLSEKYIATLSNVDAYEILTAEAANAPVGCEGLLFLPYLTGERTPHADANARGAFFGLTLRHDKRHMMRAVLEGVAYSLRDSIELFRDLGVPIQQVRATGGGSRSLLWRQIFADVFGTELVTVNVTESTVYGAALLAGVGTGIYKSVPEACSATVHIIDRIDPVMENQITYNEYYPVYQSLYRALKPAFDAVAAVEQ
ncbi:MAG: xylulokinase [Chloroflexi bacterium RBG_13_56_8]|nr:MAG: xylulokinase [Chloroflexi bacterium RBG_13_56_8]